MTAKSPPPDSSSPLAEVIAELDAKIDRVAGLGAQTVTQLDRLLRIYAANAQLDARSSSRERRELTEVLTEVRDVIVQVRDSRASLVRAAALEESGDQVEIEPFRKRDDSITASVKLQIRGEESRKTVTGWLWMLGKALAAGGVGALIRHLLGHH